MFFFFGFFKGVGVCSLYYVDLSNKKKNPWSTLSLERFVIPLFGCVKQKESINYSVCYYDDDYCVCACDYLICDFYNELISHFLVVITSSPHYMFIIYL